MEMNKSEALIGKNRRDGCVSTVQKIGTIATLLQGGSGKLSINELTDKITVSPQVMARKVGDETVLLHLGSGTYYGIDSVGARIWELISEGKRPTEICEVMLSEYEVTREDLERDTMKLLQEFVAHDLVGPE